TLPAPKVPHHPVRVHHHQPAAHPTRAHLVVSAVQGSSLLQVHLGSRLGPLIFQGTLERGRSLPFTGRKLWLYAGSPENLALELNGRSVIVGGGRPRYLVVTPTQILGG